MTFTKWTVIGGLLLAGGLVLRLTGC